MKRSQIKKRPLADTVIDALEPEEKEYREHDGGGLYLRVKPDGSKSWQFRYKNKAGKWSWKGLGTSSDVSGKWARKKAQELRDVLADGGDLTGYNQDTHQQVINKFKDAAEKWLAHKREIGRAKSSMRQMRLYLDKDILPALGEMDITKITRADCTRVQEIMEARGSLNVAVKVRSWMSQIFSQAIARGLCENNPASELRHIAKPAPESTQYPHLKEVEIPDFIYALEKSTSRRRTVIAIWMMMYTAARPGMIRHALWSEIDFTNEEWVIPAKKMKMRRDYITPLSRQVVVLLRELKEQTGRGRYLFPGEGPKNSMLSNSALNNALRLIGYKGRLVGHGARHTASTLMREHKWHKDWVEMQLAHKEEGVSGVYNNADYLRHRKHMMQWYADYFDDLGRGMTDEMRDRYNTQVNATPPFSPDPSE